MLGSPAKISGVPMLDTIECLAPAVVLDLASAERGYCNGSQVQGRPNVRMLEIQVYNFATSEVGCHHYLGLEKEVDRGGSESWRQTFGRDIRYLPVVGSLSSHVIH